MSQKSSIDNIIDSIIEALNEETKYLSSNTSYDIFSLNTRKSRLLYELNNALRAENIDQTKFVNQNKLLVMRRSAMKNATVCRYHIDALKEIMLVAIDKINDANSDRTYGVSRR